MTYITFDRLSSWLGENKTQLPFGEPINSCVHLTKWLAVQLELGIYISITGITQLQVGAHLGRPEAV